MWPGDDYVDLVCLDFYNNGPSNFATSKAAWNKMASEKGKHGPVGIKAWYDFARKHGKRFAVPEWGLLDGKNKKIPTDQPYYIQGMHDFFADAYARKGLEFESYYNRDWHATGRTQLYPVLKTHKKSSELYRSLFGRP